MSVHSDLSSNVSQRLRQDARTTNSYSKKIKSNRHSTSLVSAVRKLKSPKLTSKPPQRSSCSSTSSIQAKKITFFRNGDPFFRGVVLAISSKIYPSIDSLILDANRHPICDVSVLPKGIRYIFSTDGERITSLDELQEGRGYVFSSNELFKPLQYGSADPILSRNRSPTDTDHDLPPSPSHGEEPDPLELSVNDDRNFIRSRTIHVIRAGPRPRHMTKVTLDHKTATSLDQVIGSLENNLMMREGGIKHLCSVSGNEVKWLEDLFQEDTIFIAFATEVISPDDLLLSAAELNTSPAVTKTPPAIVCSNNLCGFSSKIKKPRIITVVNRGRAGDELGIPSALLSKYRMGKTVIWTDYAVMKRCYNKADSQQAMAMKIFDKARLTGDELDAIYCELLMLRRLKHSNILQFVDEMDTIPELFVIVEYFKGIELLDAIVVSEFFTEREAGCLMAQLCSAISYLHSLHIVHRNIKSGNILVSRNRQGEDRQLRLAALAFALEIAEDSVNGICGALEYAAPEMLQGPSYGTKVDVWSAGVICYQMLSGMLPFTSKASGDQEQLIHTIVSGHLDFPSPFWDSISDSVKDLILHMLTRNPKLRCKASDVLKHSWIQMTTSRSSAFRRKNLDIRDTVAANLEISRPSKTVKSCNMLLASSFCCRRKPYEVCIGSREREPELSLSSQSALSCSDTSDQSLFNVSLSHRGPQHISCPSAVGGNQNDATHGDTNRSRSSSDQNSPPPTGMALVNSNKIDSTRFAFNSSQFCLDQSASLPCNRVLIDTLMIDAACGNFNSSQLCQDLSACVLTGTNSSMSDIFSCHSVSIPHTSSSENCIRTVKQPCTVSTQTTSSELLLPPSVVHLPKASADNNFPSSSSSATSSVVSNKLEVIHPMTHSTRSGVPFPLSILFSSISAPSTLYSVKPPAAQNTAVSLNADNQLVTAQLHLTSLSSGQPSSGQDLYSGRPTNTKSASAGSASSAVNSAHMENPNLLSNQSLALHHGQDCPSPAVTLPPSKLSCSTFNQSGLPVLQYLVSSTKAASSQTQPQSKPAPSSLSPLLQSSLVSSPAFPRHSTKAYQQYQLACTKSKYASLPIQDSQHIEDFPQFSLQSTQAVTPPSNILPSFPENKPHNLLQQGFSTVPTVSNFHPVHEQSLSLSNAATNTGNSQPQSSVSYGSPSQMLTAALKSSDPENQGYTKDARLQSSGTPKLKMNLAKVAVETACSISCTSQENLDAEQTGEKDLPSTSPAHSKDSTSSSSSHDEFLSPSSSIQDASGYSSSLTNISRLSEDNNDVAESASWSTNCSINNLN